MPVRSSRNIKLAIVVTLFATFFQTISFAGSNRVNWLSGLFHSTSHRKLARLTAYWVGEDRWTRHGQSATGIFLRPGCCAVDPRKIPYGSVVTIPGYGKYVAVDTGTDVINRSAAKEAGKTSEERNALVIDIYFPSRQDGKDFASLQTKFVDVSWNEPSSTDTSAIADRECFAGIDWSRLESLRTF